MRSRALALAALVLIALASPASASDSNKWRIQVSGGAESDGTIVFELVPKGGTAIQVTATLRKGRSENGVARDIANAFEAKSVKQLVDSETDDGEDVLVKRRLGKPEFSLKVISNSVRGVRLNFDKE